MALTETCQAGGLLLTLEGISLIVLLIDMLKEGNLLCQIARGFKRLIPLIHCKNGSVI